MDTISGSASDAHRRRALIRTPDQRLRVFVSSTLEELAAERAAARSAIDGLRLAPVMFELGARPHPPRDLYRAYLEQSHVFLGIYWQRYGWVAPGENVSGLEDEYRLSGGRPKLVYLKTPAPSPEPRLSDLLERIRGDDTASYRRFETADQLHDLIKDDLALLLTERFEQLDRSRDDRIAWWARTNLPVPRNPIVGRTGDLAVLSEALRRPRPGLVTLVGTGGCGKSRLALAVGLELLGAFDDGVFLVALESVRDPALVVPAIAEALHLQIAPERSPLDGLADQLHDANVLLLLDNFEQVLAASPDISALLERCPGVAILATSRTPLRIRGERRHVVSPLASPPVSGHEDAASVAQYPAASLLVERARAAEPQFDLTETNAHVVAAICRRLDGLPLAIELAAARLRLLSPDDLLARLDHRLDLLRGGTRDLPGRQQTLRRAIDWSYGLLDPWAQAVFRRLSVFAGGATLAAAESVVADDLQADPLDSIAALVDDSMVVSSVGELGDMRIAMLDSMREYAAEKLTESGEAEQTRHNHAVWCAELSEAAEPHLISADEAAWATRLRTERGNLESALEWSVANDPETGLRIAAAASRFWEFHGWIAQGHGWFDRLLNSTSRESEVRARALHAAARFACYVGDYGSARRHGAEALAAAWRAGDREATARALHEMGSLALFEGDLVEAQRRLRAALELRQSLDDAWATANTLANLGLVAEYEGDLDSAERLLRQSLAIYEEREERLGVALAIGNLADVARLRGRLEEAQTGQLASLRVLHEIGDRDGTAACLESLAKAANAAGDHRTAVRLFGLASAMRDEAGTTPPVLERAAAARELDLARNRIDEATFDAEWWAGRRLSMNEVFACLDDRHARSASSIARESQIATGSPKRDGATDWTGVAGEATSDIRAG